jgi:protein gp37
MGTSVECEEYVSRIDLIRKISANIKFLSLEPLLGPLPNLNLKKIDWVIVGGESGFKARPMKTEWVLDIKVQCEQNNIPFFFKQWGGKNKKKAGRILEGKTWNGMPELSKVA